MATFLFDKIIFGPVRSRRLGLSLGVNLLNPTSKHCNFDCIYCECGWNADNPRGSFNSANLVALTLEKKLDQMAIEGELPSYITFAGNGEPTMHPEFARIIDQTIEIRNRKAPQTKIAVLSNASMIDRISVREALLKVDRAILKLDSGIDSTIATINQPNNPRSAQETIQLMQLFRGRAVIQTMMIRGEFKGVKYDNTTPIELEALKKAYLAIAPTEIMLYSTDRDTPATGVVKIEKAELNRIADELRLEGFSVSVS